MAEGVPVLRGRVSDDGSAITFSDLMMGLMARHRRALAGTDVDVIIRRHREQRTDRANRYYFGVVVPLIGEHCGYDKQEMHELLAMRFLRVEDDPITGSPRRRHTPKTDTKEFAEYVDQCIRFAAELGVYIPAPGEVDAPEPSARDLQTAYQRVSKVANAAR
jgi:hypothetical protein